MYSGGRCLDMAPASGPVHWGLENTECADLSRLDAQLNEAYQIRLKSLPHQGRIALRKLERAWLAKLRATCGFGRDVEIVDQATAACFKSEVRERIAELSAPAIAHGTTVTNDELWIASSTTAYSITGDIHLSPTRLRMVDVNLAIRVVADLPKYRASDDRLVSARVLEIVSPREIRLLNGNRFGCGEPIRWVVVWRFDGGKQMGMDTYGGAISPQSELEAVVSNGIFQSDQERSPAFCGSYYYVRDTHR